MVIVAFANPGFVDCPVLLRRTLPGPFFTISLAESKPLRIVVNVPATVPVESLLFTCRKAGPPATSTAVEASPIHRP